MTATQPYRVFVVEDEFLVALQIEDDLITAGYLVVGPFTSLSTSIAASRAESFDVATLDLNLRGELVYPLVDELLERQVPVLLLTGYAPSDLPERFRALPRLSKPFDGTELVTSIRSLVPAA
ncbi:MULTISPECIES: response regulator [Sinorhizobium]|uniref:response regulator n=1 Tax=Sinorhizobium TaxID=28105 RepID=UPI000BE7F069|nr:MULTISPECIES: response regulator [Sinorhizobium]PDT53137.1 response regulator [Sinorhizobium sp. NG07B]POH29305.1 transcriptional regulator [Sinorhizobium americanum]